MRPPVRDWTSRVIWSSNDSVMPGRIETCILHSSMNLAHFNGAGARRQTEIHRSRGHSRKNQQDHDRNIRPYNVSQRRTAASIAASREDESSLPAAIIKSASSPIVCRERPGS
jgi:hypothetical protein